MKGLTLTLQDPPAFELDARELLPGTLLAKTRDDVRSLRVAQGRRRAAIGDLFDVADNDDGVLRIENATPRLRHLGRGMLDGRLEISGTTGDGIGTDMRGGTIVVDGDAGDFVGCGMRGGVIDIGGNAGDFVGGALPDAPLGLRDGVIRIGGNVGVRAGDRMRRGLLIVNGDADRYCGANMIAGTIVVTGRAHDGIGLGMRRGTILLTREPVSIPATFNPCGRYALAVLELLRRHVASIDPRVARRLGRFREVRRFAGDRGADGQGELLIAMN